jgi:hypothetical protein
MQRRTGISYNAYPPSPGVPDMPYNNMQKLAIRDSGRFSGQTYSSPGGFVESESFRSRSPPIDERTGIIGRNAAASNNQSPNSERIVSPGFSSTHFKDQETELAYAAAGLR